MNSTVSGNAARDGSGVAISFGGVVTLGSSTVSGNTAVGTATDCHNDNGTVTDLGATC